MRRRISLLWAVLWLGPIGGPATAGAQSLWLERDERPVVALEFLKPLYALGSYYGGSESIGTSAMFLSARVPAGEKLHLVFELPRAQFDWNDGPEASSSTIGNPYFGVEFGAPRSRAWVELGVRPALAAEDEEGALVTGLLADNHRQFALLPEYVAVQGATNLVFRNASDLYLRFRLGPEWLIPSQGGSGGFSEPELALHYALLVGYSGANVRTGAGLVGLALVTTDGAEFDETTQHQVQLHIDAGPWRVRPMCFAGIWLDQALRGYTSGTVGLGVQVGL